MVPKVAYLPVRGRRTVRRPVRAPAIQPGRRRHPEESQFVDEAGPVGRRRRWIGHWRHLPGGGGISQLDEKRLTTEGVPCVGDQLARVGVAMGNPARRHQRAPIDIAEHRFRAGRVQPESLLRGEQADRGDHRIHRALLCARDDDRLAGGRGLDPVRPQALETRQIVQQGVRDCGSRSGRRPRER